VVWITWRISSRAWWICWAVVILRRRKSEA
jgi:hypothetical protein